MTVLDDFTRAYIESILFTDSNSDSECGEFTVDEIAPSAMQGIIEDCQDFQLNCDDLVRGDENYSLESAGHDFWLTRNRHGAGFWDRGLGQRGKRLTTRAHAYGECWTYRGDDGLIYIA